MNADVFLCCQSPSEPSDQAVDNRLHLHDANAPRGVKHLWKVAGWTFHLLAFFWRLRSQTIRAFSCRWSGGG